ncbi:Rho guanine nucleotide exchange factor 6 [Sparganum proliferum]
MAEAHNPARDVELLSIKISTNPRLSKLVAYTEKIVQIISMHEWLAKSLEDMKPLEKPKFVGRLFLEVAATMDSLAGEYAKLYAYVNAGLEENKYILLRLSSV